MLIASGLKAHSIDSGIAHLPLDDAKAIGAALLMFVAKLLGTELLWLRRCNHSPLYVLALLDDESSAQPALETLQDWWEILLEAQVAAEEPGKSSLKVALKAMQWPRNVWLREIMFGLDEAEYKLVPHDIAEEIHAFCRIVRRTNTVEGSFICIRDKSRHSKAGICGRKRRFHTIVESSILDDTGRSRHDESLPTRLASHEPVLASDFSCIGAATEFSLGEEFLEKYMQTADLQGASS